MATDPSTPDDKRSATESGLKAEYDRYRQTDRADYVFSRFASVSNWASSHGIPNDRIYVVEFGVIRPTRNISGTPEPGAVQWLGAATKAARQNHFLWAVFDLDTAYTVVCGSPPDQKLCDGYREALQ